MTIYELSKYQKIKLELKQIKDNLKELDDTSVSSSEITGMPHGQGAVSNPTESLILKKEKLQRLLEKKQDKLLDEQLKIENFLETVDDATVRIIIRSRFIDGKNWHQIGKELNFERTTPYYHLKKYLKNHTKEVADK